MSCTNCGTNKPKGCKSNGGCGTGGCNKMNTYDWLSNLPLSEAANQCKVVEVSFNNGNRKDFYTNPTTHYFEKGSMVTVESLVGFDVGEVSLTGEVVRLQLKKRGEKEQSDQRRKILGQSTPYEISKWRESKKMEKLVLTEARAIARSLGMDMKIGALEIQADARRGVFYYTAEDRVDFRELVKEYANQFKFKIEMRQIGDRQEAGVVGGIGSCGRELCCSSWLTDFKAVNINVARYQNLSINQTKLSGQCGRLKCCLNYELDTYVEALSEFPNQSADTLQLSSGKIILSKKDIFKAQMVYSDQQNIFYYLSIAQVNKVLQQNKQNIFPDGTEFILNPAQPKTEIGFNKIEEISLSSLDNRNNRRSNNRPPRKR